MKCPNPNCGHDADNHEINGGCFVDKCYCSESYINICDLEIKSLKKLLAEAKEVLEPFAHPDLCKKVGGNNQGDNSPIFQRDGAIILLKDTKAASAFLMKLEEK